MKAVISKRKRPPDEGSASDKIKAILKYEPDSALAFEAEKPPRKRPNDAFPSPYDGISS